VVAVVEASPYTDEAVMAGWMTWFLGVTMAWRQSGRQQRGSSSGGGSLRGDNMNLALVEVVR
jgi:hypothetical protein